MAENPQNSPSCGSCCGPFSSHPTVPGLIDFLSSGPSSRALPFPALGDPMAFQSRNLGGGYRVSLPSLWLLWPPPLPVPAICSKVYFVFMPFLRCKQTQHRTPGSSIALWEGIRRAWDLLWSSDLWASLSAPGPHSLPEDHPLLPAARLPTHPLHPVL